MKNLVVISENDIWWGWANFLYFCLKKLIECECALKRLCKVIYSTLEITYFHSILIEKNTLKHVPNDRRHLMDRSAKIKFNTLFGSTKPKRQPRFSRTSQKEQT